MRRKALAAVLAVFAAAVPLSAAEVAPKPVDYSREVQPILTANCYACHGPDASQRKAKLRLDQRGSAIKKVIKPGDADHSSFIRRISSSDPDEVMPPPDSKKDRLTAAQIDVLRRWINEGAKFDIHWSYVKPMRPALPAVKNKAWVRNAVDAFVAAEHEAHGLAPAPEADRITLIRRLSFDLIGLPPTPEEVDAFVNDKSPDAYEKVVDRLLASPHYGERWARHWLDLARYAESEGFKADETRPNAWRYRDYVIRSLNSDKPYDRFVQEQIAGDELWPTDPEARVATAFNRHYPDE